MLNIEDMYLEMGIRREVYDFGSQIEGTLKERFDAIDKVAEYNQLKVVHAMQICARAMSSYLQSENLMTHWKKSLESAHRMVLLRSTEFPIAR